MFLVQYWGGPRTYSERRGHPRLRMRHVPFAIGDRERDAWLRHMREAVDSLDLPAEQEQTAVALSGDGGAQHAEPVGFQPHRVMSAGPAGAPGTR